MAQKPKFSRKKKKQIKRKQDQEKNGSCEDVVPQKPYKNLSQNIKTDDSCSNEEKRKKVQTCEENKVTQKKEKRKFPILNSKILLSFQISFFLLVTLVLYLSTIDHAFQFDDYPNITLNSFIQISKPSVNELVKAGLEGPNPNRPVANISFALNYYFNGLEVRGYRIINIVIHLLAGFVLFNFVKTTLSIPIVRESYGDTKFIPFFTALIWLIHPLHTQSVTYIVQRMSSMAAMFFILAMLFYAKARLTPEKTTRLLFFSTSFIAGLLAFGTKQNTITLPAFIFLYEWYFFQNLRVRLSQKLFLGIIAIGFSFLFVLYLFLGSSPFNNLISGYGGRPFTLSERLLTQPRVVLHYISLLIFPLPSRLNLDYDFPLSHSLFSPMTTLLAILFVIALLGFAIYFIKNNRLYSFCILWFAGNLVIESSIIPLEIVYEHRTYLPSMMVILLILISLRKTVKNWKVFVACLASVSIIFSYWTYERNKVWKDELSLWTDIYKKSPDKARVNLNLGKAYMNSDKASDAIPFLHEGLRLYEQEVKFQQNVSSHTTALYFRALGKAYRKKGELQKSIFYLHKALEKSFNDVDVFFTYDLLGQCYGESLRPQKAIFYFSSALDIASVYKNDVRIQATVINIRKLLNKAKKLLKAQKERNL